MSPRKKVKNENYPYQIFSHEFRSIIFLSALTLNFLLLGLFMFAKVQRHDTKVQIEAKTNSVSAITVEASVLGETVTSIKSLPENFPEDFPLYFAAKLTDAWTREDGGLDAISVVWETNDSPKKVFNYYLDQLRLFGWDYRVILESGDSYTVSFQKETVEGFVGVATSESNKAIISATFGIRR